LELPERNNNKQQLNDQQNQPSTTQSSNDKREAWKSQITAANTIRLSHRAHSYRWIFLYIVLIATFIGNLIYYYFYHSQYSLVISSELNQCSSSNEIYSFPPINQTVIYAPYIHNLGEQRVYDPQMFLTAQLIVQPPNNGIFLDATENSILTPAKNSSSYYFIPKGFFSNGTDDDNPSYVDVILTANFTTTVSSYQVSQDAPNNTQIFLQCSAGTTAPLPYFEYYPIYTNANCSAFNPVHQGNDISSPFNVIGILQKTSSGQIIANCQVSICGVPFLYYSATPEPTQIGIYKCLLKPNALSILSLSYAFANALFSIFLYLTLLGMGYLLMEPGKRDEFWNFFYYEM
jgi:hypothetical protein